MIYSSKKSFAVFLIVVFLLGIFLAGCAADKVSGDYEGIIPCADCEGIKAELSVKPDNTYTFKFTYLGTDAEPYETAGDWVIDEQGRLVLLASDGEKVEQYLKIVSEDELLMLDGDGNEITGTDLNFSLFRI